MLKAVHSGACVLLPEARKVTSSVMSVEFRLSCRVFWRQLGSLRGKNSFPCGENSFLAVVCQVTLSEKKEWYPKESYLCAGLSFLLDMFLLVPHLQDVPISLVLTQIKDKEASISLCASFLGLWLLVFSALWMRFSPCIKGVSWDLSPLSFPFRQLFRGGVRELLFWAGGQWWCRAGPGTV